MSGIIPARAGFTPARGRQYVPGGDHPRSRGVYTRSPSGCSHERRIIPARAGFTTRSATRSLTVWDHPRSRGVYTLGIYSLTLSSGSSPLARGLPRIVLNVDRRRRIIPARAGFTTLATRSTGTLTDHPRSRGVYQPPRSAPPGILGSSPLARGLRQLVCDAG